MKLIIKNNMNLDINECLNLDISEILNTSTKKHTLYICLLCKTPCFTDVEQLKYLDTTSYHLCISPYTPIL